MLTDSQVLMLARELNHLLWTDDAPIIPSDVATIICHDPGVEISRKNMQCVAHTVVCAGLLLRCGESVSTRAGSALVVFPEQRRDEKPHFVMKHWWFTTSSGLCDLSLNLSDFSAHKPAIFANRNITDPSWRVSFKDDFRRAMEEAEKCHAAQNCGVFYQTDNKMTVTLQQFEPELAKTFSGAEQRNVQLRFIDLIEHCERLLDGAPTLIQTPQIDAWRMLACR
jgi:hypothetical protein